MAGVSRKFYSKKPTGFVLRRLLTQQTNIRPDCFYFITTPRFCSTRFYSDSHDVIPVKPTENRNLVKQTDKLYRERFIPLTRRTTVAYLLQDEQKLTASEKKEFERFALQLDAVITNKYASTLEEVKQLFDPLSPDKDTVSTRMLTNQERLDNEFWLLQRLSQIMEKANFYELTEAEIKNKMSEHEHHEGVKVSVDVDNYSILKFWVLGKEAVKLDQSLYSRLVRLLRRQSANQSESMYKRVISAARLKKEDKLTLKAFKDISVDDLEKVLPLGSIKIGKFDRYMIITAIGLTGLAFLSKLVTVLAKISVSWPLVMAGFTSLLGVKGYWAYRSRCNNYMAALNKTLYYKNIANNRGLLTLVIDRAQDETFKETLLTYTFVQALSRGDNHGYLPSEVTSISLENAIEQWVHDRTGAAIEFDSAEAISILEKVGILSLTNTGVSQTLSVLPLEQAHRLLPQTPLSVLTRVDDADVTEGYDRFRYEASSDSKTNNSFMKIFSSSK